MNFKEWIAQATEEELNSCGECCGEWAAKNKLEEIKKKKITEWSNKHIGDCFKSEEGKFAFKLTRSVEKHGYHLGFWVDWDDENPYIQLKTITGIYEYDQQINEEEFKKLANKTINALNIKSILNLDLSSIKDQIIDQVYKMFDGIEGEEKKEVEFD